MGTLFFIINTDTLTLKIEIIKDILRQKRKPEAMLVNIAKGTPAHFLEDNTLVNQDYIKDGSMNVASYVKSIDKDLIVTGFKRAALG
jgi:elongation factor Ts